MIVINFFAFCGLLFIASDVYVNPTHPNENQDAISEKTNAIARDSFPVICGGDHSITDGSVRGGYRAMKEKYPDYERGKERGIRS